MKRNKFLSLPVNRRRQYRFLFQTQASLIFKLSFLFLPFVLPLIALIIAAIVGSGSIVNDTTITDGMKFDRICNFFRILSLFLIVVFPLLQIGFSGIIHVFKMWIWNRGFLLFRDFKKGMKEGVRGLPIGFFYGFLASLINVGMFSFGSRNLVYYFVTFFLYALILFILFNMFACSVTIRLYYESSFGNNLKSSFILTLSSLGGHLLIGLTLLPFLICCLLDLFLFTRFTFLSLTALLVYGFFGFVHTAFIAQLYRVYRFDETINFAQFREYYHLGLFCEGDEDDE